VGYSCLQTVGELRAALSEYEDHAHLIVSVEGEDDLQCVVGGLSINGKPIPSTDPQYCAELFVG